MLLRALKLFSLLGFVAFFVACVALVRDTVYQGQDFDVFWQTARDVLHGLPAYDAVGKGAMVFKYPPWTIPVFFPLTALPLFWAKWIWGIIELFSLFVVVRWVLSRGASSVITLLVTVLFWGIWAVHSMDGQVSLPILALVLSLSKSRHPTLQALALLSLTTKIFTALPVIQIWRRWSLGTWIGAAVLALVLSIPACRSEPGRSLPNLVHSWREAAGSGGTAFEGEKVRGRENQSLTALILREAGVPAGKPNVDLLLAIVLSAGFALAWALASRNLEENRQLSGWLGLICVVHPLSWFHLFVFAFPLSAIALDGAIKTRRKPDIFVAALGVAAITIITRKTLGDFGQTLELFSIKSWGVLLCLAALVLSRRSQPENAR